MSDDAATIREGCDVRMERSRPAGGQQVGTDPGIIIVTHRDTGISITLPPQGQRSQHKRVQAAVDAILYLIVAA